MISQSAEFDEVINAGGYQRAFVADVIVDGNRVLQDVPLESCQLISDSSAQIRTQGTAVINYSDDIGSSIVPTDFTSAMTPYATYLDISMVISTDTFSERCFCGHLKVVGVGDPTETNVTVSDRLITVGSSVTLTLADAFDVTNREDFPVPSGPSQTASVWQEIGIVTGLPLNRTVADAAITGTLTYQQNRLQAVFDLAAILNGIPFINRQGQVAIDSNTWGSATELLNVGEDGTIISIDPDDLTEDDIYNQVVVTTQGTDAAAILATAELLDDSPIRYGGPFGRIPYVTSSPTITDAADAQTYADSLLPIVSVLPTVAYSIQCLPDPRREVGDVVPFVRNGETLTGRITKIQLANTGPMTLTLQVDRG